MKQWNRLKPRQTEFLLSLVCIWSLSICILFITNQWYPQFYLSNLTILILAVGIVLILVYFKNRKIYKVSRQIEKFIKLNELYKSHFVMQKDFLFGKLEKNECIDYYPEVYYKENRKKNEFYIRIRLDGTFISDKFSNLENLLADMFRTVCTEKFEEQGYLTFVFQLKEYTQLQIYSNEDFGVAGENEIIISSNILWNYVSVPHMLLIGTSGSGKSYLCSSIMYGMVQKGVRVIYCDPKADTNMMRFIHNNPSIIYATDINDIAKIVRETEEEMRHRQIELDNIGIKEAEFNPIYLFFDELIAFSMIADKSTYLETEKRINSIITMGRNKRVFFGAIMQRADTKYLDGAVRESLGCRICMGNMSNTAYGMVFGNEFSNIKNSKRGIGAGLIYRQGIDSKPREFYAPFIHNGII